MLFKARMLITTISFFAYLQLSDFAVAQPKVQVTDLELFKQLEVTDESFYGMVSVMMTPKTFISSPSITMAANLKAGDSEDYLAADVGLTIDFGPPPRVDFKATLDIKFEQTTINLYEHVYLLAEGNKIIENYQAAFGVNKAGVKIIQVTRAEGCVFRLTPKGPAVARAFSGTQVVFVEDDVLYKGWIKVMVEKNNEWIEAYVGKQLMSTTGSTTSSKED